MPFIEKPIDRDQIMMTSYNDLVDPQSMARVIDYFVNCLDVEGFGFKNAEPSEVGRPCYPPANLLKLYLYGYRNTIRSSRKLARACEVNIEVIWLMDGLKPDFRTISDFRKDNISCMRKVFKEFTRRITVDLDTGFLSIDGSKFEAWNSKDSNFTITKLDDRIKWLEDHSQEYLRLIEIIDAKEDQEEAEAKSSKETLTKEEIEAKYREAQERLEKYRSYREYMEKNNLTQLSLTDADSRLMKNKNGMEVSYNVQTAIDSETHLMVDYKVTNQATDHGMIAPTTAEIKKENEEEIIHAVADKGYNQKEDMVKCLENGIVPHVILPDGQDYYELEVDYKEEECDPSSAAAAELSKCLHAGVIPEVYKEYIEDIEVVESKKFVTDETENTNESIYGTEEEMKAKALDGWFVRDPERDLVYCPGGQTLRKKCIKKNGATRYANKHVCGKCPYRGKCFSAKSRWKEIEFSKDCLVKEAKWFSQDDDPNHPKRKSSIKKGHFEKKKVVRFKLKPDREKMSQRMCISEHPFGTIKRCLGSAFFLLRGKRKTDGEFALFGFSHNMARAENMFTFEELMRRMAA